ncbi:PucR family transcriptional regulator [Specibacter cremeus]|uniref:PucR family transcriptional regulator n=1 Tax=Specibacter cremeus TaxID=1629051 RepID=UPI000F79924C|nr:PucR family transcriptional regulator [Specibacter cremeus]
MQNREIEVLVEDLALRLGRGLSLEDLDGVLLAYSANQSHADRVRVNFLLSKRVPADVAAWQLSHGIETAVRPVVVPANPGLGMLGRVCVPLMVRGFRVGYLWVQQEEGEESATAILAQLPAVRDALGLLGDLLLESNTAESAHRRQREERFLAACAGDGHAAAEVADWAEVHGRGPWQVVAVHAEAAGAGGDLTTADPQAAVLAIRNAGLQATIGIDEALFSAGAQTHAVMLFRATSGRLRHETVLARYRGELAKRTGVPPSSAVMGVSEPFGHARALPEAYRQSCIAVQAAAVDGDLGDLVDYRGAGVYGLLAGTRVEPESGVLYGLVRGADRAGELLPVLELLYDNDGAMAAVAERLHLHRSTVYNRLARVRSIIGADPLAGRVRLELHLALKAARWAGRPRL